MINKTLPLVSLGHPGPRDEVETHSREKSSYHPLPSSFQSTSLLCDGIDGVGRTILLRLSVQLLLKQQKVLHLHRRLLLSCKTPHLKPRTTRLELSLPVLLYAPWESPEVPYLNGHPAGHGFVQRNQPLRVCLSLRGRYNLLVYCLLNTEEPNTLSA